MQRCEHLLAVCSAGAGYDVIDVEACTAGRASRCATTPAPVRKRSRSTHSASCSTWPRRSPAADRALRSGPLGDRLALRGSQLLGKTLGVVGLGAIGGRLVELCAPFGMEVLVFDPYVDEATAAARGVTLVTLGELIDALGFRSGHLPAHRRDRRAYRCAAVRRDEADRRSSSPPPAGRFTTKRRSTTRWPMARIAGAGLDVFHDEPPRQDNPLLHLDNVVATPHTAGITVEAARDIAVATATQWQTIFEGRMPPRLLNPDVWPRYCERFHDIFGFRPSATTALEKESHTR